MALAVLARDWVLPLGGSLTAFIIDHGLRPESASEAALTLERLTSLGIDAACLTLSDLARGPALAERARLARYEALGQACQQAGICDLLLGHHAGDQAETIAMRVLRGSRDDGLAGMSAMAQTRDVRLLRPLLAVQPAHLRALLKAEGIAWVEDPSNHDTSALRPRLRRGFGGVGTGALIEAAAKAGAARARREQTIATALARQATIYPQGFARLLPGPFHPGVLSVLVHAVGANPYPPDPDLVADLARRLRPTTLAGTRIIAAGRLGPGWLVVREEAKISPPVPARPDTLWDNRFRLRLDAPEEAAWGKLGDDAARFRRASDLASVVLRTLPALRIGKNVAVVPHLGYGIGKHDQATVVRFTPPVRIAGAIFLPAAPDPALPGCDLPGFGEPSAGLGM